ncbi:AAA 11 domain-containing protein [Aphis craccivora]|uniref:AAA 11 domain-containing protein n=1 Tax=Aphis craccivora TaxID=307492 RepID=A0A6G0W045_APHCR|nr:AAA 11 domain-containing protein [Aphis craccivora]
MILKKRISKWMSLCCTVGYKWVTVMDCVKF